MGDRAGSWRVVVYRYECFRSHASGAEPNHASEEARVRGDGYLDLVTSPLHSICPVGQYLLHLACSTSKTIVTSIRMIYDECFLDAYASSLLSLLLK